MTKHCNAKKKKLGIFVIFLGALQVFSGIYYVDVDQYSSKRNVQVYQGVKETDWVYVNNESVDKTRDICRQLGYTEDVNATNIRAHMSPNHEILYCRVNKCASTMTLELLKQLFDCDTDCLIKVAENVRSNVNARQIMDDAISFMVVREPYGRLFSTYCNIFYFPKEDWIHRGTKIIKLVRSNISYDSFTYGHDLTFAELIKYTVDTYELGNRLDEHVRPMHHKSCNPCVFKFDYIAHLETINTDFDAIFDHLHNDNVTDKNHKTYGVSKKLDHNGSFGTCF